MGQGSASDVRRAANLTPHGGVTKGGIPVRNILITVMMLLVVAIMFQNIIADDSTGTRARIEAHGQNANDTLASLSP